MINYTDRIAVLMEDIVARVPELSFIDMSRVLVFARGGRSGREGAYATCHCLCLPDSEPGYYFWRSRSTGELTRRSQWFVTRSPQVRVGTTPIDYMVSFSLPRFCDQTLSSTRKQVHYRGDEQWVAKLDTIVHELYHIDPVRPGIRRMERSDGTYAANCHGTRFFEDVVRMVREYLATRPDPEVFEFLRYDFKELTARFGGVAGTAFRGFPSYPQRYADVLEPQPANPPGVDCPVEPLRASRYARAFTEDDLVMREFLPQGSRQLVRKGRYCAA
ncbi:MAG: hypothetical protein AB7G23_18830 [Vicinamibacterales bacterium]